jgi:hypothetical protein
MAYLQKTLYVTQPPFLTPGSGIPLQVDFLNRSSCKNFVFATTVTNINTNVVVQMDASLDGTNYGTLISGQTITGNGTTLYTATNTPVKFIQPVFVSESGGTAAVVTFTISASD